MNEIESMKRCPDCDGSGLNYIDARNGATTRESCDRCDGTGEVKA